MPKYYNWTSHGEESVEAYFETATVPQVLEEQTPATHVEGRGPALSMPVLVHIFTAAALTIDDVNLEYCKFCKVARYKPILGRDLCRKKSPYAVLRCLPLTPCLQRLYSSRTTAEHMIWHATHQTEEGSMCHSSDAEAWKYFDRMYPDFVEESHNVWHDQYNHTYSCWPVIITPYNLPLSCCSYGMWVLERTTMPRTTHYHAGDVDVDYERLTYLWDDVWVEYRRGYVMSDFDG
ncbi:UNVERIFIED_CONTAM: hypothetical protein Scaly_3042400 [Sesamum calycinum]|uniref:Uncharacterized protein n=1 Tax=Sesamum calycinum TaxID=2727403 RepID=A0AAW2K5L1_9LAMI